MAIDADDAADPAGDPLRTTHPLAGVDARLALVTARAACVRAVREHIGGALAAAGADVGGLAALSDVDGTDALAWARAFLAVHLPAACDVVGVDAAGAMQRATASVQADPLALVVLADWLDGVAGQVLAAARATGFGVTGLVLTALRFALLATRDVFRGDAVGAGLHVADVARALPSVEYLRALDKDALPHAMVVMTECMDAGTRGFARELERQRAPP